MSFICLFGLLLQFNTGIAFDIEMAFLSDFHGVLLMLCSEGSALTTAAELNPIVCQRLQVFGDSNDSNDSNALLLSINVFGIAFPSEHQL